MKDNGEEPLTGKQIVDQIRETVQFTAWEKEIYEKTGYIRWETILYFFTIDCTKAGYMVKNNGYWYLTEEGEKAMSLGPDKMLDQATYAYREWEKDNKPEKSKSYSTIDDEIDLNGESQIQKTNLNALQGQAIDGIKDFIRKKNPYEFQELVAVLLMAMGYHTPFIAPKGKDGGIDILAYSDPLGATKPRLKVQVKHPPDSKIPVEDIRSLTGLLKIDGDIRVFITSGGFTNEAERCARENHHHIKLIDISEFIGLWREFYVRMTDEDKNQLPLQPIYFLGSND